MGRLHTQSDSGETSSFLAGGGEMGALMRSMAWSRTPLGPVGAWPQSLRTTVSTCLNSRFPILIFWGPSLVKLYNDAYRPMLGDKHPGAMGAPARAVWPEIWHIIGPMIEGVMTRGGATYSENQLLFIERHGFAEECYFTFSYSPIYDETGGIGGVIDTAAETTRQVIGERRLRTLHTVARQTALPKDAEDACRKAAAALGNDLSDVPFALLYLLDSAGVRARLTATVGLPDGHALAPDSVDLTAETGAPWPLAQVARTSVPKLVREGDADFASLDLPEDAPAARSAFVLPIARALDKQPAGLLVAGLSGRLEFDDKYRDFLQLVAGQIATAVSSARTLRSVQQRAEALAALDRSKTAFFNNVSHELRTPLTLMIAPTEEALASPERALKGTELERVYRNELRLLKLVNTLLEFARLEAGRAELKLEPTDLAALTAELAAAFRFTLEREGIRFEVDAPQRSSGVYIDRAMWEQIVLNLLSNAFKFTFEGTIRVALRHVGDGVELEVADTGVGIPAQELPHVFDQFHRIEGTRSRTHEGSGIGLALVKSLTELHGGTVHVVSDEGSGTTFTVRMPVLPAPVDEVRAPETTGRHSSAAEPFLLEASGWTREPEPGAIAEPPTLAPQSATVLIADDNADMRDYLEGLLRRHWRVVKARDGTDALTLARRILPDLILTDVLMPNLDGFELLRALRADESTASIPVIMISARAGDEARVEGLEAGADDYLVKPFGPRELVARVGAQLALAQSARERAELLEREQAARAEAEIAIRAKDEFLAMLGHELRNPLAPILTTLQLMRLHGSGELEKERATIERQIDQLVRLIDDLLDVTRITRGKIELNLAPVEIADVVAHAIEAVGPLLEQRKHHLIVNVPRDGLTVAGDEARLIQVLANLLTNAGKYTESGGRISVTAERNGGDVIVRVKDTGMGIDPRLLPNVFEMFTQGRQSIDRSPGGLGLGLSIVRNLVALHGGDVSAHSEGKGRGSEFTVRLPALADSFEIESAGARPSVMPNAPLQQAPEALDARQLRILVVDDNEDAADSLAQYLEAVGFSACAARDGPAALRIAHEYAPHVALLDIGLPIMDGYELGRRLREATETQSIRLIAVTGYGQPSDRQRTAEAGFELHLVKPIDAARLVELLK